MGSSTICPLSPVLCCTPHPTTHTSFAKKCVTQVLKDSIWVTEKTTITAGAPHQMEPRPLPRRSIRADGGQPSEVRLGSIRASAFTSPSLPVLTESQKLSLKQRSWQNIFPGSYESSQSRNNSFEGFLKTLGSSDSQLWHSYAPKKGSYLLPRCLGPNKTMTTPWDGNERSNDPSLLPPQPLKPMK